MPAIIISQCFAYHLISVSLPSISLSRCWCVIIYSSIISLVEVETTIGFLIAGDKTSILLGLPWLPIAAIGAVLLWIAAALTLITGWDYLTVGIQHIEK